MSTKWTVTCSKLNIRSGASTSDSIVGSFSKGQTFTQIMAESYSNTLWIQHSSGWSCVKQGTSVFATSVTTVNATASESGSNSTEDVETDTSSTGYIGTSEDFSDITVTNFSYNIRNALAIHGLPYQYMPIADPRIVSTTDSSHNSDTIDFGEEYAERIISRMPLLLMTPGHPDFLKNASDDDKTTVLESFLAGIAGNTDKSNALAEVYTNNSNGRYYTFSYDTKGYYQFLNPLCRMVAKYLGINTLTLDVNGSATRLDRVNWQDYTATKLTSFAEIGTMGAIGFYINSDTSISESFSNNTTESQLASTVNSISDYGREMRFLLGYSNSAAGGSVDKLINYDADINSSIENVNDIVSNLLGKGSFLTNLSTHLATVATGGKLIFPQIWSDSSFGRSYDVTCKFVSPDATKAGIYFNTLVPLLHLLCFVEPQSLDANPNGYTSPYLTRAVYKGFFNVDMGIITSMNVTRGGDSLWTPDGIPTSIEVSFTIKDLYEVLSITPYTGNLLSDCNTLNNTALIDYVANLCGINVFKPEIARMIDMWLIMASNTVSDIFTVNLWAGIKDSIQNKIMSVYRF